jgi:hypothetical protein
MRKTGLFLLLIFVLFFASFGILGAAEKKPPKTIGENLNYFLLKLKTWWEKKVVALSQKFLERVSFWWAKRAEPFLFNLWQEMNLFLNQIIKI